MDKEHYLTITEVLCKGLLKKHNGAPPSRSAILAWCNAGLFDVNGEPGAVLRGNAWFIRRDAIEKFSAPKQGKPTS